MESVREYLQEATKLKEKKEMGAKAGFLFIVFADFVH